MDLGSLIPLPTAAKRLGVSETDLRAMIEKGTISLGISPEGEIVITQNNQHMDVNNVLRSIHRDDFVHLHDKRISVTEAAEKYNVIRRLIIEWTHKNYIEVLKPTKGRGSRMLINEADVAYCAKIHKTRKKAGIASGAPLLDDKGAPYLLKHPALSRYRREQRENS